MENALTRPSALAASSPAEERRAFLLQQLEAERQDVLARARAVRSENGEEAFSDGVREHLSRPIRLARRETQAVRTPPKATREWALRVPPGYPQHDSRDAAEAAAGAWLKGRLEALERGELRPVEIDDLNSRAWLIKKSIVCKLFCIESALGQKALEGRGAASSATRDHAKLHALKGKVEHFETLTHDEVVDLARGTTAVLFDVVD